MTTSFLRLVAAALAAATGCSHVWDISDVPPYAQHVGVTYHLAQPAMLWKKSDWAPYFQIVEDAYEGYPAEWLVAELPKGTVVKVESIKRREGRTLLGGIPFQEEYVVVSLAHPKHPSQRIRAEYHLGTNMSEAER